MMSLKDNDNMWSLAEVVEANKRHKNTSMTAKARQSHLRINAEKVVVTTQEVFKPTE